MKPVIQFLFILAGSLLVLDTLLIAPRVRFNAGVILPAIIGLPLLSWGIFYQDLQILSKQGFLLGVKWLLIMCYALFILTFLWIVAQIIRAEQVPVPPDAAVLIVLGASLHGSQVSQTLALRLDAAAAIMRSRTELPVVVSGGQGPGEAVPEGAAMALYLKGKGIETARIQIENRSTSTFENLLFSKPLVQQATGLDDPRTVIVTSGTHLYRALLIARKAGYRATGAAARDPWYLAPNSLLREYLAIMKYHWLGY